MKETKHIDIPIPKEIKKGKQWPDPNIYNFYDVFNPNPLFQFLVPVAISLRLAHYASDLPFTTDLLCRKLSDGTFYAIYEILKIEQTLKNPVLSFQAEQSVILRDNELRLKQNSEIPEGYQPALELGIFNREEFIRNTVNVLREPATKFFKLASVLFMQQHLVLLQQATKLHHRPYPVAQLRAYTQATQNYS